MSPAACFSARAEDQRGRAPKAQRPGRNGQLLPSGQRVGLSTTKAELEYSSAPFFKLMDPALQARHNVQVALFERQELDRKQQQDMISISLQRLNDKMPDKKWKIQGHDRKILLHLAGVHPDVLRALEAHYSKFKHADSALPHDPSLPAFWRQVMTLTDPGIIRFYSRSIEDLVRKLGPSATRSAKRNSQLTVPVANELLNLCCFMSWVESESARVYGEAVTNNLEDASALRKT